MSKPLVLVTGATGHIGFRTLVEVLKAGYRARVTSRSAASTEKVKKAKSIQPFLSDVDFVEIPDITVPGAFDPALQGVEYILHLASPIPILDGSAGHRSVQDIYLNPAIDGTVGILDSALKFPTIKRVVITSSVVILNSVPSSEPNAPPVTTPDNLAPVPDPASVADNPWVAYRASKILSHDAAQSWAARHNPSFSILYILPSYVQGANELVTSSSNVGSGSNDLVYDLVLGNIKRNTRPPRAGRWVHVDDVARVEVASLDLSKGKTGDRFLASYPEGVPFSDIAPIAHRLFPDAVKKGWIAGEEGEEERGMETIPAYHDVSKTTNVFGVEFSGMETMVRSLIGQYIRLKEEEQN